MAFSPIPGFRLPVPVKTVAKKTPSKTAAPLAPKKTATTVVKTTPTTAIVAQPPAQPSLAALLAQASQQANALAQQQVNAQVLAIQQQQAQAHATAAAQAAEINKASLAAAQFLQPLGDMAAGDYNTAVQNLGGLVGGYTGGLRDTAQAAQDAAQAQLASIPGNAQTVEGHGADLANLLYGVSGSIPANALATQGLGATALARAIPQQTLSYGQQQAIGQIGEGNKTADALNADLITARAQLPELTSTYLKQFQSSAQDVVDQAHQQLMDANTIRNTTSLINTRNQTLKERKQTAKVKAKADAAKLKADALKNAPHLDVARSKLTGVLTDQYGKSITKKVGGKQFLQTLPGFHFDNAGQVVPDPKPVTLDQQSSRAAEWTRVNHYRSDWQGKAITDPKTHSLIPTGGWVVSPDGQSTMPPAKATKPFVPKIDRLGSTATKHLAYIGEDGALHYFYDTNKNPIPYDPTKALAPHLFNSGGIAAVFDPNTRTTTELTDDNGVPLPWGSPKAGAVAHYGQRFIDAATGHYMLVNSLTGELKDTGKTAPASAIKNEGTWSTLPADKNGQVWRINSVTNEVKPVTGYQARVPGQSTGTWSSFTGPNGNLWRINNKTNAKIDTGVKAQTSGAVGTYSNMKSPDGKHLWRINSVTNKIVKTNIPWPTSGHGALSAEATQSYTDRINALLGAAKSGIPADPDKGTPAHPPVALRSEAINQLDHAGYLTPALRAMAMAILNEYYPRPGTVGKHWFRVTNPALSGG